MFGSVLGILIDQTGIKFVIGKIYDYTGLGQECNFYVEVRIRVRGMWPVPVHCRFFVEFWIFCFRDVFNCLVRGLA